MREPGSEKKSKRNPDQISIERREFLKTAGVATAGMATATVPLRPAIAQKRREARGLSAKGVDYIDIRDYGSVEDGGDITAALNAALAANVTGGTIRIPWVGSGTYTLAAITWPGGLNDDNHNWTLEFNCAVIHLTGTLSLPWGTTIRGLATAPGGFILQEPIPAPRFHSWPEFAINPMISITKGSCKVEGIRVAYGGTAIKVYACACCTINRCALGSSLADNPALVVDSSFWINVSDVILESADHLNQGNPALYHATHAAEFVAAAPAELLLSVGLVVVKNMLIYGKGVLIKPTNGPSGAGTFHFEDLASEGAPDRSALLEMDSSNNYVTVVTLVRPTVADPGNWGDATAYVLKNTGPRTRGVHVSEAPGFSMHPDSSAIEGLWIEHQTGISPGLSRVSPSYAQSWRRDFQEAIDARLVAAPRGPQSVIGTPWPIEQDPANWTLANDGSITPGLPAPDGSHMAGQVDTPYNNGAFAYNVGRHMLAVGDWFIAGCWLQSPNPAVWPAGQGARLDVFYEDLISEGIKLNGDDHGGYLGRKYGDAQVADGAWVWTCEAFKITALGTTSSTIAIRMHLGFQGAPMNYFNPCLQYIPAGSGITDADIVAAARSYKGGWPPTAVAGDVAVLDHQKFKTGGGVRIYSGTVAPTGAAQVGDICWNSVPAVGQPKGWQCTVSGTPGTWVSMGNL
jgi:hypothetical protein